jgi:prevent-host-death family protein
MMISVGVRELREDLSKYLQLVRDESATLEITIRGEPIARLVPIRQQPPNPEEVAKRFVDLDQLIAEIEARRTDDISAVETVREIRREL